MAFFPRKNTSFPIPDVINRKAPFVQGSSPNRVWFQTGNFTDDGKPMWASRQWEPGERAEYCRTVLNRNISLGELHA